MPQRILAVSLAVAMSATAVAEPVSYRDEAEGYTDGVHALIDVEAREALARGDLERARRMYAWLVRLDPDDAAALRELGRVAAAKGAFLEAERALGRCNELRGDTVDPELHFIRGESLLALGRRPEALRELAIAESQLRYVLDDRLANIWQARIFALRGDAERAVLILAAMLTDPPGTPGFREITLLLSEAYILAGRSASAERVLRDYLRVEANDRAQDMLAWSLASRSAEIDKELIVRDFLTLRRDGSQAAALVEYGRALERDDQLEAALETFRQARTRGNRAVTADVDRLDAILSPEILAAGEIGEYPGGAVAGVVAGAMVPLDRRVRLSAVVEHHQLIDGGEQSSSSASVWTRLELASGDAFAAGGVGWQDAGQRYRGGASAVILTDPRWLTAYARADYNLPWLESATALRESGSTTGVELQLFTRLFSNDLILATSGRSRVLGLGATTAAPAASVTQHFASVGLDWIAFANYAQVARGASLQRQMLLDADFASSVVLSFRHSESLTRGDLAPRLFLVDRSRIDELSARARRTFGTRGIVGLGVTGGVGYDSIRGTRLWRAGGELLLSITPMVRLTLRSELASETTSGLTGERLTGFVGFNADL